MRHLLWVLVGLGVAGMFGLLWQGGFAAPAGHLFGMKGPQEEAAYCLAVAERIREITRGRGDPRLERHLDEQIAVWRLRTTGQAIGTGRAALVRDGSAPGVNEGAHLHLAVQDCALRAISFYGHRFPSLEEGQAP